MQRSNRRSMELSPRPTAVLCLLALLAACSRLPSPVGPARLDGAVAGPGQTALVGEAPLDAPQGPLHLREARVRHDGRSISWEVEVANPSSERLGVTLVLQLTDADGVALAHDEISFLLGGGALLQVRESLEVDAASLGADSRWQLESWVRRLPPPERRLPRLGG